MGCTSVHPDRFCKHLLHGTRAQCAAPHTAEVPLTYAQKGTGALAGLGHTRAWWHPEEHTHSSPTIHTERCVTLILFCKNDTCMKKALSCGKGVGKVHPTLNK